MAQQKILILTYVFPPVGGIMVQRMLSFARYLPQHGFDVHVLSCWNPATPVYDHSLLKLVPDSVKQFHAFTPEPPFYLRKKVWSLFAGSSAKSGTAPEPAKPSGPPPKTWKSAIRERVQRIVSPDAQVLWVPFAIQRAAQIIRKHKIDTVIVTAPPFSLFMAGNELKRRFPHIRLVSDFRDEWLRFMLDDFAWYANDFTREQAQRIERETIEGSDLVLAVTRASLDEIRSRYPAQPAAKFAWVPNGYDPALFEKFERRPHSGSQMIVTHNGTAYKTSSPAFYLEALDGLPEPIRTNIETRFIGRIAETETHLFDNRKSVVKLFGFVPQKEGLKRMEESDYLLLTMTNDFSLPGKLFEYLATGIPVLALSPLNGEVDRLLRDTQGGWCVPHTDPDAIRGMVRQAFEQRGEKRQPNWEAIRQYERPRVVEGLARILKN